LCNALVGRLEDEKALETNGFAEHVGERLADAPVLGATARRHSHVALAAQAPPDALAWLGA
jgi:hypothetical protein